MQKLQKSMVGGERANDRELKEKRLRKKKAAERRLQALAKVLSKVEDDDGVFLQVYDDIQQELSLKTDALRKNKMKVKLNIFKRLQDIVVHVLIQYQFNICEIIFQFRQKSHNTVMLIIKEINGNYPSWSVMCSNKLISKVVLCWNESSIGKSHSSPVSDSVFLF